MDALILYRLAHYLYRLHIPLFPKVFQVIIFFLFNSYIPYETEIGKGTRLGHRGIAVVINKETVVGQDVLIRAHVTIGKKESKGKAPVIGDHVSIGDGAKILGGLVVGDYAQIGANAVVLQDVPSHSVVAGVPAKVVGKVNCD